MKQIRLPGTVLPLLKAPCFCAMGAAAIALTALPSRAAEQVVLDLGPFSRSIAVESLEVYGEEGTVNDDLAGFLKRLSPELQEDVKTALTTERESNVVNVSRWYNAPMGARTLEFVGNLFPTGARLNSQRAIRAALVASAAEDGSTTVLDIARHYPTEVVRVNLPLIIRQTREVIVEADLALAVTEEVKQAAQAEAAQNPLPDLSALPDLTQPGPYAVEQIEFTLQDETRGDRTYPATLFLPQNVDDLAGPISVIVISHGLGDSRTSFFDVAEHAASHGFAVALPDHVGSNKDYREDLFAGLNDDYFDEAEFLNRPLDISFLLDELEQQNARQYQGKLNLEQVAIAGHSFGGYTVLAAGGATIDFARLATLCDLDANIVLDPAMVLSCRALELTDRPAIVQQLSTDGVRDDRVSLVMAFAPVSSIFGEQGISKISVPVMIEGGAFDILAPVVPEQVATFSWLQTPEKYLYLAENTSHNAEFTGLTSRMFNLEQQFEQGIDEGLVVARDLNKALIVAFSQVYLADNSDYDPFLTAAYAEATSEEPFNFHLVRELPAAVYDLQP